MSDRWITLLGAVGALLMLVALLYTPDQRPVVSRPTSLEAGPNGYRGLDIWLNEAGVETRSLRRRFAALGPGTANSSGNVMIVTLPSAKPIRAVELDELHDWVAAGNTLLVLAALDDSPDWLYPANWSNLPEEVLAITGLRFQAIAEEEGEEVDLADFFEEQQHRFLPIAAHPLMAGVDELAAVSDYFTNVWKPALDESGYFVVSLARHADYNADTLWEMPRGQGRIILSASGSLLTNRMLGASDNGHFFANVLAWHLQPGGTVLFDDMHQGLSDLYDPEDFFADARLHSSIGFLVAFWLLYLLGGSSRIAPVRASAIVSHQSELVAATGSLMDRKLRRGEAGRAMIENWLRELRRTGQLSRDTASATQWAELARLPAIDTEALRAIHHSYQRLGQGKKIDLAHLHNAIQRMKRTMA